MPYGQAFSVEEMYLLTIHPFFPAPAWIPCPTGMVSLAKTPPLTRLLFSSRICTVQIQCKMRHVIKTHRALRQPFSVGRNVPVDYPSLLPCPSMDTLPYGQGFSAERNVPVNYPSLLPCPSMDTVPYGQGFSAGRNVPVDYSSLLPCQNSMYTVPYGQAFSV